MTSDFLVPCPKSFIYQLIIVRITILISSQVITDDIISSPMLGFYAHFPYFSYCRCCVRWNSADIPIKSGTLTNLFADNRIIGLEIGSLNLRMQGSHGKHIKIENKNAATA